MGLIEAIILGIVQGLTEFLPISSTAHLRIVPALLGWEDPGAAFTAVIQLGTLAAVLVYFRSDLLMAITGWARSLKGGEGARTPEARLGWAIFIGTLPIVVFGLLFKDPIEHGLRSLYVVAGTLIAMGALLWGVDVIARRVRDLHEVSPKDGLWVGLWQAVALIPGASRSGSTITGALLLGFDRATAARFSFLLSVPSIFAAGVFSLKAHWSELGSIGSSVIVATGVSFVVGYASIAFLIKFLQTRGLAVFAIYRFALGGAILIMLATGVLTPDVGLPGGQSPLSPLSPLSP